MSHKRKVKKSRPRRTLKRTEERVNFVWFCSLDEQEQEKIFKSCIDKARLKDIKEVAEELIKKYDEENATLNFYSCPYCDGFHTTGANKHRRNLIRRMIIQWKRKNKMPTSRKALKQDDSYSRKILEQIYDHRSKGRNDYYNTNTNNTNTNLPSSEVDK